MALGASEDLYLLYLLLVFTFGFVSVHVFGFGFGFVFWFLLYAPIEVRQKIGHFGSISAQ